MSIDVQPPADAAALARAVALQVLRRTWGQVGRLTVEAGDDVVRISGVAPSYYVKQLITHAALDTLGSRPFRVQIDVEVKRPPARGDCSTDDSLDYVV